MTHSSGTDVQYTGWKQFVSTTVCTLGKVAFMKTMRQGSVQERFCDVLCRKEGRDMRFIIKYEIRGRIRVHVIQNRMTYHQADMLHYYLSSEKCVTFV